MLHFLQLRMIQNKVFHKYFILDPKVYKHSFFKNILSSNFDKIIFLYIILLYHCIKISHIHYSVSLDTLCTTDQLAAHLFLCYNIMYQTLCQVFNFYTKLTPYAKTVNTILCLTREGTSFAHVVKIESSSRLCSPPRTPIMTNTILWERHTCN